MGIKNYVCIACGQDFTRKYSAYRHNRYLHEGGGRIVRTLEYIIGRITGEYSSADPVLFRGKRKDWIPTRFPFANVAHDSENSHRNDTTQNDSTQDRARESNLDSYSEPARIHEAQLSGNSKHEQIKYLCSSLFPKEFGDTLLKRIEFGVLEANGSESVLDACLRQLNMIKACDILSTCAEKPEEVPLRLHTDLRDLPEDARVKLAKIEQIMTSYKIHPSNVFEEIKRLGKEYRFRRDLHILDAALDRWSNKR